MADLTYVDYVSEFPRYEHRQEGRVVQAIEFDGDIRQLQSFGPATCPGLPGEAPAIYVYDLWDRRWQKLDVGDFVVKQNGSFVVMNPEPFHEEFMPLTASRGPVRAQKRAVTIRAIQTTGSNTQEALEFAGDAARKVGDEIRIQTLEGEMRCPVGWWIIQGVAGEFYPCDPSIFEQTYDIIIEDSASSGAVSE